MILIKTVLAAVNSKYIHSSLPVRSLAAYADFKGVTGIVVKEYTINNPTDTIIADIFMERPDVVCFSCYIWNIGMIITMLPILKKIMPSIKIVLGGPEVSYGGVAHYFDSGADFIIRGEGEGPFSELITCLLKGDGDYSHIKGLVYIQDGTPLEQGAVVPLPLNAIPFVYERGFAGLENKILYYESSRGCPYACRYCLSSAEQGVRFLTESRYKADLDIFLNAAVKQVKFVDRTFNCNKKHAMAIWRYLIEKDNGVTNFHFEISAELIDTEMMALLAKARKGLFQFEAGIQSTNLETLDKIQRKSDLPLLYENVKKIKDLGNIHIHLDLIAGLPGEDYKSFISSYNTVYALRPDMLQLGFLKLLKGSGLRADAETLGISYRAQAPYEVLYTRDITYEEMLALKGVEEVTDRFYNSGNFKYTLDYVAGKFSTPFDFYLGLYQKMAAEGYLQAQPSGVKLYTILYEYICRLGMQEDMAADLLKFDLFLLENARNIPAWMRQTDYTLLGKHLRAFYENEENRRFYPELSKYQPRQIARMCHVEHFGYDVLLWAEKGGSLQKQDTYLLFNYYAGEANRYFTHCSCRKICL